MASQIGLVILLAAENASARWTTACTKANTPTGTAAQLRMNTIHSSTRTATAYDEPKRPRCPLGHRGRANSLLAGPPRGRAAVGRAGGAGGLAAGAARRTGPVGRPAGGAAYLVRGLVPGLDHRRGGFLAQLLGRPGHLLGGTPCP